MKKKLSAVVLCSLLAVTMAGCAASGSSESGSSTAASGTVASDNQKSDTSDASSAAGDESDSSKEAQNSDDGTGNGEESYIYEISEITDPEEIARIEAEMGDPDDEDGSVSEEASPSTDEPVTDESLNDELNEGLENASSEGGTEAPASSYISCSYIGADLEDSSVASDKIDGSQPKAYLIKSADELSEFIKKYQTDLSLNKSDEGLALTDIVSSYDADYFAAQSVVILPFAYQSGTDHDIGDISVGGGKLNIPLYAKAPSSGTAAFFCYVLTIDSSYTAANAEPNVIVSQEQFDDGGEP